MDVSAFAASGVAVPFLGVFVLSLAVVVWSARRTRTVADYFVAGGRLGAWANALALAGDFVAAGGLLGLTGLIALNGADGMVFAIGVICGWPLMLFVFAGPLKRLGLYTLADVVTRKLGCERLRSLVAANQVLIVVAHLTAQLMGGSALIQLLTGLDATDGLAVMAVIVVAFMMFGGMIATTWLQIIKAVMMISITAGILLACLAHFGMNPLAMMRVAVSSGGPGVLAPGRLFHSPADTVSLLLGLTLGGASMPHVLMRMNTVANPWTAMRSVQIGTGVIVVFHIIVLLLGFSAMALLGVTAIRAASPSGDMTLPLLARFVGGDALLGIVSAVALSTILAVTAGLAIAGSGALAHDLWAKAVRRDRSGAREQMVVGRLAGVLLVVAASVLAYGFHGQSLALISALGGAVAAATNFPVLVLSIFVPRFNARGAVVGIVTGAVVSLLLIGMSPLAPFKALQAIASFPLRNPGIIAIPLAFAAAWLASLTGSPRPEMSPIEGDADVRSAAGH